MTVELRLCFFSSPAFFSRRDVERVADEQSRRLQNRSMDLLGPRQYGALGWSLREGLKMKHT